MGGHLHNLKIRTNGDATHSVFRVADVCNFNAHAKIAVLHKKR
jgi:hypothetical protein